MLFLKNVKAKGATNKSFQNQTYKVFAVFGLTTMILTYLMYTFVMGFMMSIIISGVIGLVAAILSARFIYGLEDEELGEDEVVNDLRKVWDVDLDSTSGNMIEYLDGNVAIILRLTHGSALPSDSENNEKFYIDLYNYLYGLGLIINTQILHQEVSYQPFEHINKNLGDCEYQGFHEMMSSEILHLIEHTGKEIRVPVEYITVRSRMPKQRNVIKNIYKEALELKRSNSSTIKSIDQLNKDEAIQYFKNYLGLEILDTATFTVKTDMNVPGVHVYGYVDPFGVFNKVEDIPTRVKIRNLKQVSNYTPGEEVEVDEDDTDLKDTEEWVIGV